MKMFEVVENWALHAFADGELEGDERKAMEKLLAENDEARKALSAINFQKVELRKAYGATADEPVPQSLLATAQGRSAVGFLPYAAMAASVALVLMGGAGGWFAAQNGSIQTIDFAQRALVAHEVYASDQRHPVELVAADRVHLQGWLSNRLGDDIVIPTLDFEGFTFLGGRLLAGDTKAAGLLMYEDTNHQRLTVFIGSNVDGQKAELQWVKKDNLITCYWRDDKLAMAVTGDMQKDDIMALAKNIYDQMDAKG
jgi:anti-sigma factor RsiW